MYDQAGRHVGDFGRGGQGPGELSGTIMQLGVTLDGRVFVALTSKIEVFSPEGGLFDTRTFESGYSISTGSPMTVGIDGVPYVADVLEQDGPPHEWKWGMIGYGADGPSEPIPAPVFDFEPQSVVLRFRMNNGVIATGSSEPPFAPQAEWALLPDPEMVGGTSDTYAFTRFHPDGTTTRIEQDTPPTTLFADEADWYGRRYQAYLQTTVDPPRWSGSEIATTKPAFERFIPDYSGRVWVLRPGEGQRQPGCDEEAVEFTEFNAGRCWRDSQILDVFGKDGRYLGDVEIPAGFRLSPRPYINGGMVVGVAEDESGITTVKRYRLVLPGEQEE